jgi:hypothetical protein
MQNILPMKRPRLPSIRKHSRRWGVPALMFLAALPVYAQSTGSDPWDNAVNVLKTAFAMRGSGGIPLRDVEEECERSIDLVAHVMNRDGWRHVTEIRTSAEFADGK